MVYSFWSRDQQNDDSSLVNPRYKCVFATIYDARAMDVIDLCWSVQIDLLVCAVATVAGVAGKTY